MTEKTNVMLSKHAFMKQYGMGDSTFKTLVENGMPGRFESGRWYISTANFEKWFNGWTAVCVGKDVDENS